MVERLYTAKATATGGRTGRTATPDGELDLTLSGPTELGGEGEGTNPEQLFAAGYASCFHSSIQIIGGKMRQDLADSSVTAHVGIGPDGSGSWGLEVELHVELPNVEREKAEKIVATAKKVCPYSKATAGNVETEVVVDAAKEPAGA